MKKKRTETIQVRGGKIQTNQNEHSNAIFATSGFLFDSAESAKALFADEIQGNMYSRYGNPSIDEFSEKLRLIEGAEDALPFSSGMAAIFFTIMGLLRSGDHIISSNALFGSSHKLFNDLFPRWNIHTTYVDPTKIDSWSDAIQDNTKLLFVETPSNPGLSIVDLAAAGQICEKHNLVFVADNTFASPVLQKPLDFGAHISLYSGTKYLDGQGRTIAGAALGDAALIDEIRLLYRNGGPTMSPFTGWILNKSLETLTLRVEKHCENALKVAQALENNTDVLWVKYPFLPSFAGYEIAQKQMAHGGGIVTFEPKGGRDKAFQLINALKHFSISANLGDTRSIVTHPASTTHAKISQEQRDIAGISDGMIRLSIGLENVDDLIEDLERAISSK